MKTLHLRAGLALCALSICAATRVHADAVTDWNEITMAAVTASRPGPIGMLDVALVQVAVHDAVQAYEKRYEPYYVEIKATQGSRSAAVAAAARDVLAGMYPDPAKVADLDAKYVSYLAQHGLTNNPGLAIGQQVAARILPLRRKNPDPLPPPFVGSNDTGVWRPTDSFLNPQSPTPFSPMVTPYLANMDPFTLTGPARFRAPPPPALTSDRYRKDYDEVKALGAFASTVRTPEQTDIAYFYSDNFFNQWNRVLRSVANARVNRIGDSARLFALANMAAADALITSWDSKKYYVFWRPLTAIREGENDGNPRTIGDSTWQPLINTPNYPDYSSGANSLVGAMTRTLARFFGRDRVTFEVTSAAPQAITKTRTYQRFSDAAKDVVDARVYLGIHFRFADTAAREQGEQVADWAIDHFLQPTWHFGADRDFGDGERD